jgi:hypothetical protein
LREFFLLFLRGLRETESGGERLREEICFWDERERGKVRGYIEGGGGGRWKWKQAKVFSFDVN